MSEPDEGPQHDSSTAEAVTLPAETPTAADELEPQLKYERLGADVKSILQDATATCLCLSEKVLALGTSAGNIHILDYSGNEVKRFSLHSRPVKAISFDDKAEYFASCCGDNYISVSSLYSDETNKFTFKRPITVIALEPRYASRKTREFVTGDVRGRLKLSSQGWLGRSDHVLHQGEGTIRAINWHGSTLVWANEVGIKVYDTNMHQFVGNIKRPRGGRFADCFDCQLYVHDGDTAEVLYVAWPDCIKVADVLTHVDPTSGAVSKALRVSASIPTDYFCLGVVPHGQDLAVLVYVTDQDPDQTQIMDTTAAAAAGGAATHTHTAAGNKDQQGQLTMQPLPQQQQPGGSSSSSPVKQRQDDGDSAAAAAAAAEASGPSTAGPINIPQPVRRAANAFVRSPSGPSGSLLAASDVSSDIPADGTAATAGASSSSSPDKGRAAGGGSPAVQRSPSKGAGRPPLPSYSRSLSATSRGSSGAAAESLPAPYCPPGNPLRPELRILSLADHTHTPPAAPPAAAAAAAGTSKMQQQQQCSACSEVASDALSVKGYEHYLPADYHFVPSYGNEFALLSGGGSTSTLRKALPKTDSSKETKGPHGGSSSNSKGGGKMTAGSGVSSSSSSRRVSEAVGGTTGVQVAGEATGSKSSSIAEDTQQQQQQQQQGAMDSAAAEADTAFAADGTDSTAAAAGVDQTGLAEADSAAAVDAAVDQTTDTQQQQQQPGLDDFESPAAAAESAAVDATAAAAADVLEDFREFMYFIVSPQDIVIGRHRDMEDRISWCLAVGRYESALQLAEADRTTTQELWDTVVQAYLDFLTAAARWSDAAAVLPRLLKEDTPAWERWLFTFAQARQLPLLAPVLPVKDPLLPSQAYDLVLQALLVDPSHHSELLSLVSSWPHSVFHPTKLIDTIAQRMQRPGGESRELWQVLALLYKGQGRPDLSLAIYLQLQLPSVFDFIQEHGLLLYLDRNAYLLMAIDEKRALELLASHLDTLPPGAVVPGLLDAMSVCESKGDEADREVWRHRLFNYLDKAFGVEPAAVSDYAELCVHLYADYCPGRLMDFLQGSQTYPLEAALEVAQQRGLIDEQVYVLSRMGNSRAALRLIIRNQQDIPRAIEFVRLQQDEELWEELIDWALSSADTTGQLLDHIGGNINPLRVIQKIPEGLAIDKLRDRLRAIISDFRTQTSLREGCNAILRSDCLHLVQRLQREVKRAMPTVWLQRMHTHGASAAAAAAAAADGVDSAAADEAAAGVAGAKVPPKGAASVAAAAGMSGSSYLPRSLSTKGPHWLKYQSGSGRAMLPASSQDVPAVAVHALATMTASGGVGGVGGAGAGQSIRTPAAVSRSTTVAKGPPYSNYGFNSLTVISSISNISSSSIGLPMSSAQPSKVWIGRTGAGVEEGYGPALGSEGVGPAGEHEEDGLAVGGVVDSQRATSSRQQTVRRRGSGAVNLPSLVTA